MSAWSGFESEAPELASRIRGLFESGTNKTIATLRRDGAPRISGTELQFRDGEVTLGMMPASRKLADVLRDPRVAIHSPTLEPPEDPGEWAGEAKLSGSLRPIPEPEGGVPGSYFALHITEAVLTSVDGRDQLLVVESWHPGRGMQRLARA